MKKINICVIGAGQWGLNHIKTLILLDVQGVIVDGFGQHHRLRPPIQLEVDD